MSFRLAFPAPYREEEITLARLTSQRNARVAAGLEASPGDGSGDAVSQSMSPAPQKKKRVVLPDPVAFK